jgi:hypothetical protein
MAPARGEEPKRVYSLFFFRSTQSAIEMNGIVMSSFASVSTLDDDVALPFKASRITRIQDPGNFTLSLSNPGSIFPRRVIPKMGETKSISCSFCDTEIIAGIKSCNELPSQYFQEVLECYYCHNEAYPFQPPETFTPRAGTILHNSAHVLVLVNDCSNIVSGFNLFITSGHV